MRPRRAKKKSPPPSRLRYEASHPVVSVRISRELQDQLDQLKEQSGLSMADILRIGLERAQPIVADAHKRGYCDALGECLGIVDRCPRCYQRVCELIPDDI